jgi:hypothetical protein
MPDEELSGDDLTDAVELDSAATEEIPEPVPAVDA